MIRHIINYFDRIEDKIRHRLSRHPVLYAFVGGVGVVLFWKGIWDIADLVKIPAGWSLAISLVLLILSGTFVSFFIGEQIIMSGITQEKRIEQKTEAEIIEEDVKLSHLDNDIESMKKEIDELYRKFSRTV